MSRLTGDRVIAAANEYADRCDRIGNDIGVKLEGSDEAKAEWRKLAHLLRQLVTMAELQTVVAATVETGVIRVGVY